MLPEEEPIPASSNTRTRVRQPTHRPSSRRTSPAATPRRSRPTPRPIEVFHKSYSEPMIFPVNGESDGVGCRSFESDEGGWFCRVNTLDDLVLCNDDLSPEIIPPPLSARVDSGYKKDAKVLITVTVEGSPGPIKILVKLGATVEDTIKLVVQKYGEEGRTPRLDDKNAASFFDLHVSYFSLESLDRANAIGDVGSRSFYLRKVSKKSQGGNKVELASSECKHEHRNSPTKQPSPPMLVLPSFYARTLNKILVPNSVPAYKSKMLGFNPSLECLSGRSDTFMKKQKKIMPTR